MVVVSPSKSKAWLSAMRLPGFGHPRHDGGGGKPSPLGILAFEAARTMSRLVALHRALSDAEVARLRSAMRAPGVAYLNSADQAALLRLACAEMVDDLDAAAAAVARLGRRCSPGAWPRGFEHVYAEVNAGVGDVSRLGLGTQPKEVEKKVKKMKKYVAATSALHAAMEGLAELEAGVQRQLGRRKQQVENFDALQKRLSQQRHRVRQLREESLWVRDVDKVTELMARSIVSVFARLCTVYGPVVADLPFAVLGRRGRVELLPRRKARVYPQHHHHQPTPAAGIYSSGPLERAPVGTVLVRNSGPILRFPPMGEVVTGDKSWKDKALAPPAKTLGASGLALRYANVVALVESLAGSPELVAEETRDELYWMLPAGIRAAVAAKLRGHVRMDGGCGGASPEAMAGGWREAVEGILGWLAPMARDTLRWHSERSFEQRQLDPAAPRVLALQTLAFSDKEKAEAAIVELLVAFSCVCRYRLQVAEEDEGES